MNNKIKDFKFKDLLAKLKRSPIDLLEEKQRWTMQEIIRRYPGKTIFVCDVYISGIENGIREGNILRLSNVIVIDHHAPLKMYARKVSSTNLAINWVKEKETASKNAIVAITHTDYDSIMSALIIRGIIPPRKIFGDMAIIADHTGEENEPVDLLQSMSSAHNLEFSLRNLELWSNGDPVETKAFEMLEELKDERKRAKEIAGSGDFKNIGMVYYAKLSKKIESAYFPAFVPEAAIILTYSPHRKHKGQWEAKTRLGYAAPEGLCLNKLGINEIDPFWGGRWNAGSNRRGDGTKISIEEYAEHLNNRLDEYIEKYEIEEEL